MSLVEQDHLFDAEESGQEVDRLRLLVHFLTPADRQAFAQLVGQRIAPNLQSLAYPIGSAPLPAAFLEADIEGQSIEQHDLFSLQEKWHDAWKGMPAYGHEDLEPLHTLSVYFPDDHARKAFARLLGQQVSDDTKSLWYPKAEIDNVINLRWKSTQPQNPKYPVYVPTKGRWDSAFTIKCLERLGVPYYAVVQPQEQRQYEGVVKTGTILVLPRAVIESGPGVVPARNWIMEHSIALGAKRHWQLDDNIKSYFRYHENRQIHVADGTCLRIAEDFVDRYENIAIAGFQYFMFVKRKFGGWPPYVFNTRVYSNSLIDNSIPFRWRDIYNEDTDICLSSLKAGWCTVQFNAFLAWKQPTLVMKGGNTDILYAGVEATAAEWVAHAKECKRCDVDVSPTCEEGRAILQKDGRWRMADSLVRQHPDVTTIMRRWNRWQHYVDYRQFKQNEVIVRPDFVLPEGQDEYGLELVEVEGQQLERLTAAEPEPVKVKGPSVFAFLEAVGAEELAREKPSLVPGSLATASALPGKGALAPIPFDPAFFRDYLGVKGHQLWTQDGKILVSESSTLTDAERNAIKTNRDALIAILPQVPTPPQNVTVPAVASDVDPSRGATESDASRGSGEESFPAPAQETPVVLQGVQHDERRVVGRTAPGSNAEGDGSQPPPVADSIVDSVLPDWPDPVVDRVDAVQVAFFEDRPTQTLAQFLGSEPPRVDPNYIPDEPPDLSGIDDVIVNVATDGVDWLGGHRPGGVTVSTLDGTLCRFLPFRFQGGNLDEEAVKEWARRELRGKKITNAKTKFDLHMFREWGIDLEAQGCTFSDIHHTAALLDDHRKRFALDVLCADYFPGEPFVGRVDESRHLEHHPSEVVEREKFTARLVGRLRDAMYPEIDAQDLRRVQDLEDAVIPTVVEMEKNGSLIDMELLERYGRECNAARDALLWEVSKECGFAFEHTAAGWKRLIESLHLAVPDSFSESVLDEVDHPLIRKGQRASQYAQLNSKIFKAYPEHIVNGILRYNINQLANDDGGTVSGRFSIGIVQQVPNEYNHSAVFDEELFPRRLFIPGIGDYLEADAAQIEFRLLVHYSENAKLLQAYRDDPWMSFHKKMQEMLVTYKPDMNYAHTKSYNFAAQYGARSIKLAIMMGFITAREGDEIRQAKRWDDPRLKTIKEIEGAYKKAHPEAGALLDRASHLAKPECDEYCKRGDALHRQIPHRGYVKTFDGRRSRYPTNYKTYSGLNRVLQGTGALVMKRKLAELHAVRKETGFVMRITNHDAVLGDATTLETLGKVNEILNRQSFPFKVPILWQCGIGPNWAETK